MSRKRSRTAPASPSRAVPSAAGFSPASPASPRQRRAAVPAAPDQRERYRSRRLQTDPELSATKTLWMSPELLFRQYGLQGFLFILKFETYDTGGELGTYTKKQIDEITTVFNLMSRLSFANKEAVRMRLFELTEETDDLVKAKLRELWVEYSSIPSRLRF